MKETICLSSKEIEYLRNHDKRLAKVISEIGDIEYNIHSDYYAFLVTTIVGQQLSNKAAHAINRRLSDACGDSIQPESINSLSDETFHEIGIGKNKIKYIRCLTYEVLTNPRYFEEVESLSDEEIIAKLTKISGIGYWTAKMFLIFALDRKDVLPYEDMAFLQTYKWLYKTEDVSPEAITKKCKKWKPYTSIASRYMYKALDDGLTQKEFHLYKS